MTEPLPYHEAFTYADGSAWPAGWGLSPFYTDTIVPDVTGGRGRVPIVDSSGAGAHQFAYRIAVDPADPFDVTMLIDISEVAAALDTVTDPAINVQIALDDPAEGRAAYQLYLDPYAPLQAGILQYDASGQPSGTPAVGYVEPAVDPASPIRVRIVETGTTCRFKIWQGTEPADSASDLLLTGAPLHAGGRFVDLLVAGSANGSPYVYFDDITVAAASGAAAATGGFTGDGSLTTTASATQPQAAPPPVPPTTFINPTAGMVTHYLDSFTVDLATGGMSVNTRSNLEVTGL